MMLNKFLQSTRIDMEKIISGTGYDLIALRYLQPEDKLKVEKMIIRRKRKTWRDIEALDILGTDKSIQAITKSLQSERIETKIEAADKLHQRKLIDDNQLESILVGLLWTINEQFYSIRFHKFLFEHQTPLVLKLLLWNTLYGQQKVRAGAAASLYYLLKITASPTEGFPVLCFQFDSKKLPVRKTAFIQLCHDLNIDPATALDGMPTMSMVAKDRKTLAFVTGGFLLFILILTIIAEVLLQNALK